MGINTAEKHRQYKPVVDVSHSSFDPIDIEFKIVNDQRITVVPVSGEILINKYLSEKR